MIAAIANAAPMNAAAIGTSIPLWLSPFKLDAPEGAVGVIAEEDGSVCAIEVGFLVFVEGEACFVPGEVATLGVVYWKGVLVAFEEGGIVVEEKGGGIVVVVKGGGSVVAVRPAGIVVAVRPAGIVVEEKGGGSVVEGEGDHGAVVVVVGGIVVVVVGIVVVLVGVVVAVLAG